MPFALQLMHCFQRQQQIWQRMLALYSRAQQWRAWTCCTTSHPRGIISSSLGWTHLLQCPLSTYPLCSAARTWKPPDFVVSSLGLLLTTELCAADLEVAKQLCYSPAYIARELNSEQIWWEMDQGRQVYVDGETTKLPTVKDQPAPQFTLADFHHKVCSPTLSQLATAFTLSYSPVVCASVFDWYLFPICFIQTAPCTPWLFSACRSRLCLQPHQFL